MLHPVGFWFNVACELALTALSSTDLEGSPTTAEAGIRVLRDGDVQEIVSSLWTDQNTDTEWIGAACETSTVGDSYECRLTKSTGTDPAAGPALATWHTINTTRQWTWTRSAPGTTSFTGTLEIREIADTSNLVSASVTISAQVTI